MLAPCADTHLAMFEGTAQPVPSPLCEMLEHIGRFSVSQSMSQLYVDAVRSLSLSLSLPLLRAHVVRGQVAPPCATIRREDFKLDVQYPLA